MAGRLNEAAAIFRRLIAADPIDALAYENLGMTQLQARDAKSAEASLRRAIAFDPSLAGAYTALGVVLAKTGRSPPRPSTPGSTRWRSIRPIRTPPTISSESALVSYCTHGAVSAFIPSSRRPGRRDDRGRVGGARVGDDVLREQRIGEPLHLRLERDGGDAGQFACRRWRR